MNKKNWRLLKLYQESANQRRRLFLKQPAWSYTSVLIFFFTALRCY